MSVNKSIYRQTGFTIIEVVLVLAIAGLIFLMVFIALPALQRNQRDTQRKRDLERVIDAGARWQSNNRGQRIDHVHFNDELIPNYLEGGEFKDPDGSQYYVIRRDPEGLGVLPTERKTGAGRTIINRYHRSECDGANTKISDGWGRYALSIVLEGGGVYCVNN